MKCTLQESNQITNQTCDLNPNNNYMCSCTQEVPSANSFFKYCTIQSSSNVSGWEGIVGHTLFGWSPKDYLQMLRS